MSIIVQELDRVDRDLERGRMIWVTQPVPSLRDPDTPFSIARGGRMNPMDICKRGTPGSETHVNIGLALISDLTRPASSNGTWQNESDRGGNFDDRGTSMSVVTDGTGVFDEPLETSGTNMCQCSSQIADTSVSGPTTNNLLWPATDVSAGTGVIFGLVAGKLLPDFTTGTFSKRQHHTFLAQNTSNRLGYTNSNLAVDPDFTAGYDLGFNIFSQRFSPTLQVANGSGTARLRVFDGVFHDGANFPDGNNGNWLELLKDVGGHCFFFFSKYLIRASGATGDWTPVLDVGFHSTHKYGMLPTHLSSALTGSIFRHPYNVNRLEGVSGGLDSFANNNARFLEACDGTSGVDANYRMCVGGLNQSSFDVTKRANSEMAITEVYVGNDSSTSASGKLGAITGETIEEKGVYLEDKNAFYDVRHAGFCSAFGLGHVESYIKYYHELYGSASFFCS